MYYFVVCEFFFNFGVVKKDSDEKAYIGWS